VFFGRNDSGKSNILRALNLFFNGETNASQSFAFKRDLCSARSEEAGSKQDARKFVSVKVTFNTPKEYQKSLGPKAYVKKTWSISTGASYNFDSSIHDETKQQYLTRFLNRIHYHYIPAIKDRSIFEKLLGEVYAVLSKDERFVGSLDAFAAEVRSKTTSLTGNIKDIIGLISVIAPPVDLMDLFKSLDFETRSEIDQDDYSLTLQRGDGLQVMHIPTIMKFIADESPDPYHIWGFEEPENSLELVNAITEAQYFRKLASNTRIQIFMTSHSPAFFNIEDVGSDRFFVSRKINKPLNLPTSKIFKIEGMDSPSELMGETPHLAVISTYLRDADNKIAQIERDQSLLINQINSLRTPIVFVEGDSDAKIIEKAWRIFTKKKPGFAIISCSGTSKMHSLAANGPAFAAVAPDRLIFCLVDNDKSGRELYRNGRLDAGGDWVRHNSNGTYWCRLKPTDEFKANMKELKISEASWPFVLESSFSWRLREEAATAGLYALRKHHKIIFTFLSSFVA